MKFIVSLMLGLLVGASVFLAGLYFNPFVAQPAVSPLSVPNTRVMELAFSAVPHNGLLYTNNGEKTIQSFPNRVSELWEPAITDTSVWVTELRDSRGDATGIGIKFTSPSEQTRLVSGQAIANSVWHIYLPTRGTLLVDQTENYWPYLRDIVIPARLSSGDNWRGNFHQIITNGPGALGTARLTGGSGDFAGLSSESVESVTASAYSAATGPVSMDGTLTMALPLPNRE